ncbi:NAD(P)H-hydrate dehydratase [Hylemonella sp. W303a]|uniref:NAD(P)H-hydrate dehydratase n=1 Tax=Hylemonella sp. W303a TaxID=3389873 RepID=UPI00396B2819
MQRFVPGQAHALHTIAATQRIEQAAQASLPAHTLMQRAGRAVACLALAIAPHARRYWIACGPGNNGGDGLEAATHLLQHGKTPIVTWLGHAGSLPEDARLALEWARAANVVFSATPPEDCDCAIDALLGLGVTRPPDGQMAEHIAELNRLRSRGVPVLSVDLPTGLQADTGNAPGACVQASHTLALLTLKPGLFTAQGRDAAGDIWFDELDVSLSPPQSAQALLNPAPATHARKHATHKGSYGDVAVIGGAPGMGGAALLAARAALQSGAGRVYVGLLDPGGALMDALQPELMLRRPEALMNQLSGLTVVCGCGGDDAVSALLPDLLSQAPRLVLDADALNAVAKEPALRTLLQNRGRSGSALSTVLTPHPLEAARLLNTDAHSVQTDRLAAAQTMADRWGCTIVLKGSGTVISTPGTAPRINPTGNGRLATAGTGDVLAGLIGARLAQDATSFEAACSAVYAHGLAADSWPPQQPLTAGGLARVLGP